MFGDRQAPRGGAAFWEVVLAKPAEAIDIAEIIARIPHRIHEVMDQFAEETPDYPALVEDAVTWNYRELHHAVRQIAVALQSLGIRPGDRMMIVSENCIALAGLLLAASWIDAWAIGDRTKCSTSMPSIWRLST